MEYLGTLFGMGKTLFEPLRSLKENEGILDKKIEELSCSESDVRADLDRVRLQCGRMPKKEVQLWLKNVESIKDEVHDIKKKLEEVRWTSFLSRINLAKQVKEKIKEVVELKDNGRFQNGLFADLLPASVKTFPAPKLVGETTALTNLKKIEECLMDDEVGKIGVYGMGGVGKTTIATHIYNKFNNAGTFNSVIWVTVSKEATIKKLQDSVFKAWDVPIANDEDELRRSSELHEAFKRRGKVLLILDDMWSTFPLIKVGIPEPNEENKCKILWTTRSKKVCRGMGADRKIEVDGLTKDESWTLFKEKIGAKCVLSQEIEPIAKAVVEECDGLPLAIITVGAAMRGVDDIRIWKNALEDLKNSRPEIEGLEDDVFACLKFSFDYLKTQRLRDCFLYCALYPEDHKIPCDLLIEYWMAEGFFDELEDREKGFDKGYTIISDLKDACMLETAENDLFARSCVKMHDLLRDLAISITRKGPRFMVKVGSKVAQFPRVENSMDDVVRVSLMECDITMPSCECKCPELSTLLLVRCSFAKFPHTCFEHMQRLRVLDLSDTCIRSLPQSLSNLVNLHALLLGDCGYLKEVPSLVQLRELRVLKLYKTGIQYLPEGMDGLTNLRCLDLSFTIELEMFPVGILSNFSHLEELLMLGSKWQWSSNGDGMGAGVEEILRLTHLRKLLVDFSDFSAWCSYVRSGNWRVLKCFLFSVGYKDERADVPHVAYNFYSQERRARITNITQSMSSMVLPESNLTVLWITRLPNLRTICMGEPAQGESLGNLKSIEIYGCPTLKYVFSVAWLQTLQNLECMDVEHCQALEEMMVDMGDMREANNNITITLPRLKKLRLVDLPMLKRISRRILICSSLETIQVDSCTKLERLPLSINSVAPSSLKKIEGSIRWWHSLEWDDPNTKMHLQHFFSSPNRYLRINGDGDGGGADSSAGAGMNPNSKVSSVEG